MRIHLVALTALAAFSTPAVAQSQLTALASQKGRCTKLVHAGKVLKPCKNILVNSNYSDGRSGFYFTAGNTVLTFSGFGSQQINEGPDRVTQPVDMIITSASGKSAKYRAVGTCRFGNPYKGRTKIECSAAAPLGQFEGVFETDDTPPDLR
jgi:hypothetical protein